MSKEIFQDYFGMAKTLINVYYQSLKYKIKEKFKRKKLPEISEIEKLIDEELKK